MEISTDCVDFDKEVEDLMEEIISKVCRRKYEVAVIFMNEKGDFQGIEDKIEGICFGNTENYSVFSTSNSDLHIAKEEEKHNGTLEKFELCTAISLKHDPNQFVNKRFGIVTGIPSEFNESNERSNETEVSIYQSSQINATSLNENFKTDMTLFDENRNDEMILSRIGERSHDDDDDDDDDDGIEDDMDRNKLQSDCGNNHSSDLNIWELLGNYEIKLQECKNISGLSVQSKKARHGECHLRSMSEEKTLLPQEGQSSWLKEISDADQSSALVCGEKSTGKESFFVQGEEIGQIVGSATGALHVMNSKVLSQDLMTEWSELDINQSSAKELPVVKCNMEKRTDSMDADNGCYQNSSEGSCGLASEARFDHKSKGNNQVPRNISGVGNVGDAVRVITGNLMSENSTTNSANEYGVTMETDSNETLMKGEQTLKNGSVLKESPLMEENLTRGNPCDIGTGEDSLCYVIDSCSTRVQEKGTGNNGDMLASVEVEMQDTSCVDKEELDGEINAEKKDSSCGQVKLEMKDGTNSDQIEQETENSSCDQVKLEMQESHIIQNDLKMEDIIICDKSEGDEKKSSGQESELPTIDILNETGTGKVIDDTRVSQSNSEYSTFQVVPCTQAFVPNLYDEDRLYHHEIEPVFMKTTKRIHDNEIEIPAKKIALEVNTDSNFLYDEPMTGCSEPVKQSKVISNGNLKTNSDDQMCEKIRERQPESRNDKEIQHGVGHIEERCITVLLKHGEGDGMLVGCSGKGNSSDTDINVMEISYSPVESKEDNSDQSVPSENALLSCVDEAVDVMLDDGTQAVTQGVTSENTKPCSNTAVAKDTAHSAAELSESTLAGEERSGQVFKWKFAPSYEDDTLITDKENSDGSCTLSSSFQTLPVCRKPIRVGLSRKQRLSHLHQSFSREHAST